MTLEDDPRLALMDRLTGPERGVRSEATITADIRMLLLDRELGLAEHNLQVDLETPVGAGRRIDIEVGSTVIEVKRAITTPAVVAAATAQLAGYVRTRAGETGQRYVGVLTDGQTWLAFNLVGDELVEVTRHVATSRAAGRTALLRWLEGVLATREGLLPTPGEIAARLGASSPSHALDLASLRALYDAGRDAPTVKVKRELWASLLSSALGTQFSDDDELFLEHTLLVASAEIIAHLVVGLDPRELNPVTVLAGDQFTVAGLHGVVDRDFFDWVLEVEGGPAFVTTLSRRLARFDFSHVEHDVLKVLYESVITPEVRKSLGEYYTPDWLAAMIVDDVVEDPINQRVLDPSCGSGTFLFFAVRRYLNAADEAGVDLPTAMEQLTSRVAGIDLHPVAVALARVTYLLAIGRARLVDPARGSLSVPVYLGDSLGWDQREDLLSTDHLVIATEVGDQLLAGELRFPRSLLDNAARFDDLVESLVTESGRAAARTPATRRPAKLSDGAIRRLALPPEVLPDVHAAFLRLRQLHEADRNHVWSYFIRNVARPAWMSRPENQVDVLVGNPPWLAYRFMSPTMQQTFKRLSKDRSFWSDERTVTHQDLAGLFVARASERYLRPGGRFAFVVPNSVVDRSYWAGFRAGAFDGVNVTFTPSWDLRRVRPHLFPRGCAVIFAERTTTPGPMPHAADIFTGQAPRRGSAATDPGGLARATGTVSVTDEDTDRSPYHDRFTQGANLVPRLFLRTQRTAATGLGTPAGRAAVRSRRSATEKPPWKTLPDLRGTVETEFLRPTVVGENVLPFRLTTPDEYVIPVTDDGQHLKASGGRIDASPGLAAWIRAGSEQFAARSSGRMTLDQQIDHMGKLRQQFPLPSLRVLYGKSGMHLAAAVLDDPRTVVDHTCYWSSVVSQGEADYLVGVLNAPCLTTLVRPLMSYGKDERHIDKHVWRLPIPRFDPDDPAHWRIVDQSRLLAEAVGELDLDGAGFVKARQTIRRLVAAHPAGRELDQLVADLVGAELDSEDDGVPF